ncbi:LytR/AlgR family response regulator transcription factor [Anaerosporobacter sp.]|uniref:LytR/AlgR family response regulator transcription factor n=1 Tax=Anaerosporobacter sp. TaxID=1872529 RepID=UPI00286ED268|nr:LytTR family DNA-binding domain-containing protein [Anaerosporobacter sp.]
MSKVYVCEDNDQQREFMSRTVQELLLVEEFPMEYGVATANPHELLEKIKGETDTGIFFLDIDLQCDMNGMELAQKIRECQPRSYIIFATTHSEMSHLTFKYKIEALDYIIKDNRDELKVRIQQCLHHVMESETRQGESESEKNYFVQTGGRITPLSYEEILFFEISETKGKMYVSTKDKCIEFKGNMKEIEEEMDERFCRCHRSFFINLDNIETIDEKNNMIVMAGGAECPISVRLKKKLLQQIEDRNTFMKEQL